MRGSARRAVTDVARWLEHRTAHVGKGFLGLEELALISTSPVPALTILVRKRGWQPEPIHPRYKVLFYPSQNPCFYLTLTPASAIGPATKARIMRLLVPSKIGGSIRRL